MFEKIDTQYELGYLELPPHVVESADLGPLGDGSALRETPMPPGTPLSFGHSIDLENLVKAWYDESADNYGVALVADKLDDVYPAGDQHVHFQGGTGDAFLRLTLDRR